ncbi:MAG: TlpA disulfide reductase family protein [Ferruginibacter sp.]
MVSDSLMLDAAGSFYLKTNKVKFPQRASLQKNEIQVNDFFIAPGYNLTLTASGNDFKSINKSKKICGTGAESNRYKFLFDSIIFSGNDTTKWFLLDKAGVKNYAERYRLLKDSVAGVVFSKKPIKDPWFLHFKKMAAADALFEQVGLLASYASMFIWKFSYDEAVNFPRQVRDSNLFNNMFKKEYLVSGYYKYDFISSTWLNYLISLDIKKDSSVKNNTAYRLSKINAVYTGAVKEYCLFERMTAGIEFCTTDEELKIKTAICQPYIAALSDRYLSKKLLEVIAEKTKQLYVLAEGRPAPAFTLLSNKGRKYSLEDFKGKLVYIDFWASWCSPCRAETPALKTLYEKLKTDKRIAFISIAVNDSKKRWEKALEEDKPGWIQLFDADNTASAAYSANLIPKFVLIDKLGHIISSNAPSPSDTQKLESLIASELTK